MIEDMRHLQVIDGLSAEVQLLISQFNALANGITDKMELSALRIKEIDELCALLAQHKRALRAMRGEPYDPVAHTAEAVLVGLGGLK